MWGAGGCPSPASPSIQTKAGCSRWPGTRSLEQWGILNPCRYLLHDRHTKFCTSFRDTLAAAGVKCWALPARSPNLNAFAER